MSNLAKLLQMQKGKKNEAAANPASPEPEAAADPDAPVSDESGTSGSVPPAAEVHQADESSAGTPASSGETGSTGLAGKLNLLGRAGGNSKPAASAVPGVAGSGDSPASESADAGPVEFSLDDIAGLDESSTPSLNRTDAGSGFLDEIEATAPDRDLPEDITAQQINFVESLDGIYQVLNDPEMFGQAVRVVMMELQENPEYERLIADQDVHTMILGMRNTMGLARIKKQEKSRKSTGTSRAKKGKAVDAGAMALLDSLLGGGGDDD